MAFPDDYWASYEHTVASLDEALAAIHTIAAYQSATGTRFVWRGVSNASYPLQSSLVRSYIKEHEAEPTETQLRAKEKQVLAEARDWGLDWHSAGGRLSALELLAALQHYGVPTRMLDFTFNPLIALWFAVEQHTGVDDGRIFAIDASKRLLDRNQAASPDPWWLAVSGAAGSAWTAESWIWRPPPFEARIIRQDGCFLLGGIPSTQPPRNAKIAGEWRALTAVEVRKCMSVPFTLINYQQAVAAQKGQKLAGQPPKARSFTVRIANKDAVKAGLERAYGYSHRSLFPDFPGLTQYGQSFVR